MPPKPIKPPLTHFLCIPLITETSRPVFEKSLHAFSTEIFRSAQLPEGLAGRAVRPVDTLHLTLGVMSLLEQERIDQAIQFLQDLNVRDMLANAAKSIDQAPLKTPKTSQNNREDVGMSGVEQPESNSPVPPLIIALRSVRSMQSPSKTSILYAPPTDDTNRLLPFAQSLRDAFQQADLIVPENRPLKLHATIVNTIYGGKGGRGRGGRPVQFDASRIIEEFDGFEWAGNVKVERLAICKMGANKLKDGQGNVIGEEYEEVATRKLPGH